MATDNPLITYRAERGMTRPQLAELLGVPPMTLYRWEREIYVPQERFRRKIKEVTGISIAVEMRQAEPAE